MTTTTYKTYIIQTIGNSSFINKDGQLIGATYSDEGKNNSIEKAKKRIDNGKVNLIK